MHTNILPLRHDRKKSRPSLEQHRAPAGKLGAAEYLGGAFVIGGGLVVSGIFGCCEEPEQPDSASALLVGGLASQSNRMPSVDLIQFVNQKGAMFEDEVSPGKIAFPNPLDETNEKE